MLELLGQFQRGLRQAVKKSQCRPSVPVQTDMLVIVDRAPGVTVAGDRHARKIERAAAGVRYHFHDIGILRGRHIDRHLQGCHFALSGEQRPEQQFDLIRPHRGLIPLNVHIDIGIGSLHDLVQPVASRRMPAGVHDRNAHDLRSTPEFFRCRWLQIDRSEAAIGAPSHRPNGSLALDRS